ncbi:MFS transporter [Sphingomonas sp.]|uniref:MFS transporter n=1 Tax=Sphingomonas sp. TaxID=28214 RepID=UPI002C2F22B0|nr:MFS transporter [Sphingomonas sp.]HTG37628.1 MFS transporter [Sphingomonas sp.]
MIGILRPEHAISADRHEQGLRRLVVEAAFSSTATVLTSGVILMAYAMALRASNLTIGLLASAPFLCQLLQIPAVFLVERFRARKAIAVLSSVVGRAMLAVMALAAFVPASLSMPFLLTGQFVLCAMGAVGGCAWNAWLRDMVPPDRLGGIIARRTGWASVVTLVCGLMAALMLDDVGRNGGPRAFALLYAAGCATGMVSAAIVARIPEPEMDATEAASPNMLSRLVEPLRDLNFRALIRFLVSWQFAINLSTPFFTVFLIRQLGYSMTFVMMLTVTSQLANLAVLRAWGTLSDRFAHKSVMSVAAPVYILSIGGMIGASQMADGVFRSVYLIGLHLLMGVAVAGVTLATTSIALKLSPRQNAPAYIATAATFSALAAGIAPILGGAAADFFQQRRLEVTILWQSPSGSTPFQPFALTSWDFYFAIGVVLGIYALHRLSAVREEGEIERGELLAQFIHQTRRSVRNLSTVAGLRASTELPAALFGRRSPKAGSQE